MQFAIQEIITITAGRQMQTSNASHIINNFCTDSRRVRQADKSIFIALKTHVRDGHLFIESAYQKGIRCFLISKADLDVSSFEGASFILVDDTLRAMQTIAAAHRLRYNIPVYGITGSNGKTIIKEWLALLFSNKEDVVKNPKSYNSQLGVALAVSGIQEHHSLALLEAGISEPDEMNYLQKMIQPDIGIFTTIGAAHGSSFSSIKEKIREKLILFKSSEKLFYCMDHDLVHEQVLTFLLGINPNIVLKTWGEHEDADLKISSISKSLNTTIISAEYDEKNLVLELPYTDSAYIENALHCWLVLLDAKYKPNEIAPWFMQLPPVQMRLELLKGVNDCTLINDTYSSDLASLRIALDFLYEQKQHKKYSLILSDILQHGKNDKIYEALSESLKQRPVDKLILIGDDLKKHTILFADSAKEVFNYDEVNDFLQEFDIDCFENEAILIKGARRFMLERVVNRLEQNIHRTVMSINLSALINNVNTFKKKLLPKTKIMAMVKAFAYGSGSHEIASTLERHGVDYLAVAYVDEGILLRNKGVQLPILILNPELSSLDAMLHYDLEPEVYSIELLHQFEHRLSEFDKTLSIHIKLDTGMHRLGVEEKDLDTFLAALTASSCFKVQSVFSHLAGSDEPSLMEFTKLQKAIFERMGEKIDQALGQHISKHIANSTGALHDADLQFDMVRLGLGLYGISNSPLIKNELQQISTLKTNISQIKHLSENETVGYGRAGILNRDSVVATLNIGYADGYARAFSNGKGKVLINGSLAPVVGNVCMDMIMVDITDIDKVKEGDEVIIFGDELAVTNLAQWIDTIPYEIIAGISQRVKRVFYQE